MHIVIKGQQLNILCCTAKGNILIKYVDQDHHTKDSLCIYSLYLHGSIYERFIKS